MPSRATPLTELDLQLLTDDGAWNRAGVALRACDPQRYLALLKIAEDVCSIHRDPLGEAVPSGFMLLHSGSGDDFD